MQKSSPSAVATLNFQTANGESFTRVDFTEGTETFSGGNGICNHDETSENMSQTWAFTATSPGTVFPTALSKSTWAQIKLMDF